MIEASFFPLRAPFIVRFLPPPLFVSTNLVDDKQDPLS